MGRIYIRHAEKTYPNGAVPPGTCFKFDPPLTAKGRQDTIELGKKLLELYGPPKYIVTSPYRRCRETADILRSLVTGSLPLYADARLSEYLGNHPDEVLDVTPETKAFGPPHPETLSDYDLRINQHNIEFDIFDTSPEPVWIVAHGMTLSRLARLNCGFPRLRPPFLGALIISNDDTTKKKVCQMLNGPRAGILPSTS